MGADPVTGRPIDEANTEKEQEEAEARARAEKEEKKKLAAQAVRAAAMLKRKAEEAKR